MKELVEHIRTVHFTLLIVLLGSLAIVVQEPGKSIEAARLDFSAIRDLISHEKDVAKRLADEVNDVVKSKPRSYTVPRMSSSDVVSSPPWVHFPGRSHPSAFLGLTPDSMDTGDSLRLFSTLTEFLRYWDSTPFLEISGPLVERTGPTVRFSAACPAAIPTEAGPDRPPGA